MEPQQTSRIALVSGANRGLGFESARQLGRLGLRILLTSRDASAGETAAQNLVKEGLDAIHHPLDIVDPASVARLVDYVSKELGRVDVLVNNAGVFLDAQDPQSASVFRSDPDLMRRTLETNLIGHLRMCQAFVPGMKARRYGRVVNVSSTLGQLSEMGAMWPAYRISKAALNALTRIVAAETHDSNVLVNSVCPGRVRTAMGGPDAPRSVEQGADTIVWLATLPDGAATGGFFHDRTAIPW